MATTKKLMGTTAVGGAAAFTAIEDVFSTYLYTGNGSIQTITNGIDLAGEGGMVWIKRRDGTGDDHILYDTERGATKALKSNTSDAESTRLSGLTGFNSDGFDLGFFAFENGSGNSQASWTFRKAPRFFDVVTYTGDGVAGRAISHNLGIEPGFIVVKRLNAAEGWFCQHRNLGADKRIQLDQNYAATDEGNIPGTQTWYDTPTDSVFYVGSTNRNNGSGSTYVAYLFAHDPLGESGDGSDGLIACGSYTGNGSATGPVIDLGWEPQWVMIKNATTAANWHINDNMRGMSVNSYAWLYPNLSNAESYSLGAVVSPTATGFKIETTGTVINNSGDTYIYIAIRRGPMRQPTSGTEVFVPTAAASFDPYTVGFPTDLFMAAIRGGSSLNFLTADRLRGETKYLVTSSTAAEATDSGGIAEFDLQNSFDQGLSISSQIRYNFRRSPGFFDVVAYTGDGVFPQNVSHNLGVAPEMMVVKARNNTTEWEVYHSGLDATAPQNYSIKLNDNAGVVGISRWFSTAPTDSVFSVGGNSTNQSGTTYIAYLFATLPGVSKVGSYTGNGSSQTIDCGFTSGARFVLIKRADSTGDWYVWDTARGIVTGNDPHLSLNTTAAEVTTDDSIDPASSGFIVNQVAATNINVSSASYIFYAIA